MLSHTEEERCSLTFCLVKSAKGEAELYSSIEFCLAWGKVQRGLFLLKYILGNHGKSSIQVATLIFLPKKPTDTEDGRISERSEPEFTPVSELYLMPLPISY